MLTAKSGRCPWCFVLSAQLFPSGEKKYIEFSDTKMNSDCTLSSLLLIPLLLILKTGCRRHSRLLVINFNLRMFASVQAPQHTCVHAYSMFMQTPFVSAGYLQMNVRWCCDVPPQLSYCRLVSSLDIFFIATTSHSLSVTTCCCARVCLIVARVHVCDKK